ncbi:MAG: 3-methyl-2-oxobutanoate hydroxymethyltransferase [Spirochaetota bacterium]|nr:3-methyl-2-oxobutanoate hydroxymethyltransferase [Spirochaetota bacterium]
MKKITVKSLIQKKIDNEKIVSITAYDYTFARIIDQANVDIILVGDSLSNVCAGYKTTLPITLDEMIYHSKAVRRGVTNAFLMADLPFLSYQVSIEQAIMSAGRLMKEAEVEGVKLEGGEIMVETIYKLTQSGIPVMGHIGFTPQSEFQLGGHFVQGKDKANAEKLKHEAKIIEEAGAFGLLLEMIPQNLAKEITESISIPTIGIGAGPHCDGQILVCYDLLGMNNDFSPKFLRKYAQLNNEITSAVNAYSKDIKSGTYPSESESYS